MQVVPKRKFICSISLDPHDTPKRRIAHIDVFPPFFSREWMAKGRPQTYRVCTLSLTPLSHQAAIIRNKRPSHILCLLFLPVSFYRVLCLNLFLMKECFLSPRGDCNHPLVTTPSQNILPLESVTEYHPVYLMINSVFICISPSPSLQFSSSCFQPYLIY